MVNHTESILIALLASFKTSEPPVMSGEGGHRQLRNAKQRHNFTLKARNCSFLARALRVQKGQTSRNCAKAQKATGELELHDTTWLF